MTETPRLLLLEDSRFDAELLRLRLRKDRPRFEVQVATSEAEFVAQLAQGGWQAVLSDYEIPGWGGAQALAHVRAVAPELPFIFVSGVIGEDNAVELLKSGATDYVSKGRLERLPVVLDRALAEAAERRARAEAERELIDARERAEQANLAKDRFLAVLSHELRTPLTPVAMAAEVLERMATVLPEHAHLLPMIRRNVAIESRLIDDLLDLTAISAGKIALKPTRLSMHRVMADAIELMTSPASERGVQLVLDTGAEHFHVWADEARMQQVLWNLLRNAIKFSDKGGAIRLQSRVENGQLVIRCVDSGIGIAAEALPRIFTLFEQASQDVARDYGGLGIGLAIARALVQQHGGELTAHSEGLGHGATFTLRIPLQAEPAQAGDPAHTLPDARPDSADAESPPHVLLVEDNADSAEVLAMGLEAFGYRVDIASTCGAGLSAAAEGHFDAIVTDLGLPDQSGLAIGEAFGDQLPVIALSGWGAPQDVDGTRSSRFAGHITKPADLMTLDRMLRRVLVK